jgi:hypothetical protein
MDTNFPTEIRPKTLYVVEFEWMEPKGDDMTVYESVRKQLDKMKIPEGVSTTDQHAGACWGSWMHVEGENWQHVKEYAEKVLRLLKRRGCRVEMY